MRPRRFETCTIWPPASKDDWGNITYGAPAVYNCSVRTGGTLKFTDSKGVEFMPKDTFWVLPVDLLSGTATRPAHNWLIAEGDHRSILDPTEVGADQIKGLTIHRHTKFGQGQSWVFGT